MKILLLIVTLVILSACTTNNTELATQYKLDLQYYQYAIGFQNKNMTEQAVQSCSRTKTLSSECYTSLVQDSLSKKIQIKKEICNKIQPEYKINMTMQAFRLVYPEITGELQKELKEMLKPSKERIQTLTKIKTDCVNKAE